MTLRAGGTFRNGRYLLVAPLGRGGFATVWRARDTRARGAAADVAIKLLASEDGGAEAAAREAEVTARVRHPNVVTVRDTFSDGEVHAIVMELALGTLAELVEEQGPLSPGAALGAVLQACDGLAAAHEAGVVHRDVKPQNLLVFPGGVVKLGDFGVARAEGHTRTRTTNVLGSIPFMAPEQRRDPRAVRPATDVYAMAVTTAWLITGRAPGDLFAPGAMAELVEEGVPVTLAEVLVRAGAYEAQARPKDAAALAEALRGGGVAGEGVSWPRGEPPVSATEVGTAQPGGQKEYTSLPSRRRQWLAMLALATSAVMLAMGVVALWPSVRPTASATVVTRRCSSLPSDFDVVQAVGPREVLAAAFDDLDHDGHDDLFVTSQLDEVVWVFRGTSPPTLTEPEVVHVGRSGLAAHPVDVDGDGEVEILTAERDAGRWAAYARGTSRAKLVGSWPEGPATLMTWDVLRWGSSVAVVFPSALDNCVLARIVGRDGLHGGTCLWRTFRDVPARVAAYGAAVGVTMAGGRSSVLNTRNGEADEVAAFDGGRPWIAPSGMHFQTASRDDAVLLFGKENDEGCVGGALPAQPEDVGDYNGDGIADFVGVKTCMGCTSEIRLALGRPTQW